MAIPAALTREDLLQAISDLDKGIKHSFGDSTKYDLVYKGKRYPPKAVVGLAARRVLGRSLRHEEFSGGEGTGQANGVLRQYRFRVEEKMTTKRKDWSQHEVRATVEHYFQILDRELADRPVNKAEVNRQLREKLDGRSKPAVEFKFANVSAVLDEMGLAYVDGYKPMRNIQDLLRQAVDDYLRNGPKVAARLNAASFTPPKGGGSIEARSIKEILVEPPRRTGAKRRKSRRPTKPTAGINYALRDERSRALGRAGEKFVVTLERRELKRLGRPDLAKKVDWVADTRGDGLGYDVLSFSADGQEKYIEVKTTNRGKESSFSVTVNEVRVSEMEKSKYVLYRLFSFRRSPKLYIKPGSLSDNFDLRPTEYRITPGS